MIPANGADEAAARRARAGLLDRAESRPAVVPSPLRRAQDQDAAEELLPSEAVQAVRAPPRLVPELDQADERGYGYASYGELTGPLTDPPAGTPRIALRRLPHANPRRQLIRAVSVLGLQRAFLTWLLLPGHSPILSNSLPIAIASIVMLVSIYMIELFRLINVASLCIASALARDPIPMIPKRGTRVAFLTTIVPSREPIQVVRRTLEAARSIRHDGVLDLWLLDEGNDPEVRQMCRELGVRHFTRRGVDRWNQPSGGFKAQSKHGNYNAWVDGHGSAYDFFISVDPDHVPLPSYCERLLGYFRDPDVAFAVGPQVYGNYDNLVTKCAESQQFVFHGLIQRLGNFFHCPMLVGTNNAVRIWALREIGGLRDSITEDLATSLSCHAARNHRTGNRWRSVYTPDLLAVGEGPSNFTDFFNQQRRWSRGTFEGIRGHLWRSPRSLPWGPRLRYWLIASYYPSAALGWILGTLNCVLYLLLGARGFHALTKPFPTYPSLFLMPNGNLFFTGANAGFGPAIPAWRTPGIWNPQTNAFRPVRGMRDPNLSETGASVLLAPAQEQRYAIIGGGSVGDTDGATGRIDVAKLNQRNPRWEPDASLPVPTRYAEAVITPDDKVFISGGSSQYRGAHRSDIMQAHLFDPRTSKLTRLADPPVPRDYHAEALLLPDGRIITLGGNPLYGDKLDDTPGFFEQRIAIYSPPYLYHGPRPRLTSGPAQISLGATGVFGTSNPGQIKSARLVRPGASTHVTDLEQRSIALRVDRSTKAVALTVPGNGGLVPPGWYMVFVTNRSGVPSQARWVQVDWPKLRGFAVAGKPGARGRAVGWEAMRFSCVASAVSPLASQAAT